LDRGDELVVDISELRQRFHGSGIAPLTAVAFQVATSIDNITA